MEDTCYVCGKPRGDDWDYDTNFCSERCRRQYSRRFYADGNIKLWWGDSRFTISLFRDRKKCFARWFTSKTDHSDKYFTDRKRTFYWPKGFLSFEILKNLNVD